MVKKLTILDHFERILDQKGTKCSHFSSIVMMDLA